MTKALPGEFSVCFTELQQKFFHNRPRKLTDLILLVKYWYQQVTFQLRHLLPASVSFQARALTSGEVGPPGIQPIAPLCPCKQHPDRHRTRSLRPSSRLKPSPSECPPPHGHHRPDVRPHKSVRLFFELDINGMVPQALCVCHFGVDVMPKTFVSAVVAYTRTRSLSCGILFSWSTALVSALLVGVWAASTSGLL